MNRLGGGSRLKAPEDGIVASGRAGGWLGTHWKNLLMAVGKTAGKRTAQGRNLARSGRTRALWISPGLASAQVVESEAWNVSIRVRTFDDAEWRRLFKVLLSNLTYVAALLEGELSEGLVAELAKRGIKLMPEPDELDGDCDCEDYMTPCAHMAAVHTVLADALDGEPFLLLTLRGRTRQQILAQLRSAWGDKDVGAHRNMSNEEPPPGDDWYAMPASLPPYDFRFQGSERSGAGLLALGPPPGDADLMRALEPLYAAGAEAAVDLAMKEHDFPVDTERMRAFRRSVKRPSAAPNTPKSPRPDVNAKRTPNLTEAIVDTLAELENAKSKDIAKRVGASLPEVRTELLELEKLGIVYRTGQTRGTRWWLG